MSYYRPSSSSNQKRSTAAAALREQVKNGGNFAAAGPGPLAGSVSPIGGNKGRPSSAPTVNNNMGRGLQRGAMVGGSNTSAVSAYSFTSSSANQRPQNRRSQSDGSSSNKSNRPSSQQMQRTSFLPNSKLNRNTLEQSSNRQALTRHSNEKAMESSGVARNPLRSNDGSGGGGVGKSINAPAPRARSSGHVRQQYLAHLGIDTSASPSLPSQSNGSERPGSSGGLNRQRKNMPEPLSGDKRGQRVIPGTNTLDATPPVIQPLSGGTPVWWKRAFTKGDTETRGRTESGKRNIHFNDQVEVRFVPLHSDYSQRVRQKYWTSAQELWEMAARNSIEFASEGYDFRNVVEEENFTRWGGQLIHPAHVQGNPSFGMNRTR